MIYQVDNSNTEINFAPPSEINEIIQNVKMILSTVQNSVPLFREFGVNSKYLDSPINIFQTKLTAEIAEQISLYEPRAVLKSINLSGDLTGKLVITAIIEV